MANGIKKADKYPENVREFCMKQQYFSTFAYKSLRMFFSNNLPTMRTLQRWYSTIDASPGVCEGALDILREKTKSYQDTNNNSQLYLTLMSEEMSIRKELCWSAENRSFGGYSTIINSAEQNANKDLSSPKLAKDALVFMVVGPDFKLAVGYEFLNGLESKDRAALTLKDIESVEGTGARLMSLTNDGLAANITTAESLGAKFEEGKPYFMSPTYPDQKIYFILDPPHILKLVRKQFSSKKIEYNGQLIDWSLLEALVDKQSLDNFNLGNKLSPLHMNWSQKPMNVRLAAETISNSVANTLEQLRKDGYDQFSNSRATEEFIRYFNDAFDILNFKENTKEGGKYKQKLCRDTANHIFQFAERFKEYISQLQIKTPNKSISILKSSVKRGFFGFYFTFISLQGIYEDFVLNGPLDEFYTFQFSQDHLETFFSLIR